ncbi:unnamed protein product [Kuraishia capsulata CBS 1993]|uniref:Natural resistance-associated macrophage protein n=1 Tax=Kuraishia capsulata CBS 1993 TaxID=1382522 RepID=W6MJG1_9ASCO|nr:uncharacterized protein KUCA_T00002079001 [Kuraishia capsulata CBS 1993]CDK26108.1 unnamed protein product [Kuraishia capsulata CBS 1993]
MNKLSCYNLSLTFAMKRAKIFVTQWVVPALLLSASFMDTGNYVSAVSAGTISKYQQLIPLVVAHIMAGVLQYLSIILGVKTKLNLGENFRKRLPHCACVVLGVASVSAIVLTDICQVIGSAVALEVLFDISTLPAVLLSVFDVSMLWRFHRTSTWLRQATEMAVAFFSLIIFSLIFVDLVNIREKLNFKTILVGAGPSADMLRYDNYILSLSLLGSTAMPHSLFLVSEMAKMMFLDQQGLIYALSRKKTQEFIKDLTIRLVFMGVFGALILNVSLVVLSAALSNDSNNRKNFSGLRDVYSLFSESLSQNAGTCFLYMLLLSGQSFGFIGNWVLDIVLKGMFDSGENKESFMMKINVRYISVCVCFICAWIGGDKMLTFMINATQVVLAAVLALVSAPLVVLVCQSSFMSSTIE